MEVREGPAERVRHGVAPEATSAGRWLGLAIGSLVLAGILSLLLVVARMPPFDRLVTDPLFFRRCLVVHVDLSIVVWFFAFAAALLFALPARGASGRVARASAFVSASGVTLMVLAAGASGSRPVLSNYVPMIDHPVFSVGLIAFGVGVVASFLDTRLLPGSRGGGTFLSVPDAAVPGLRATAIALLLAALTFAASWATRPDGLVADTLFELANWGGGHVLQLATTCAMLSVWLILLAGALGHSPISRRVASALFALLVLPWLAAPVLAARGIQDAGVHDAFTSLMRFAIFPVVAVFIVLCARAVIREKPRRDPRVLAFAVSATLAVAGAVLGALIRGSTTMVPAHYHASIGAVTVAFMGVTYPMLEGLGYGFSSSRMQRAARVQPAIYGVGQMVFAIGFGFAGAHGMARKAYGHEQQARSAAETAGMVVMGLGGLVAIAGGLLFLTIVIAAWRARRRADVERDHPTWRLPWSKSVASIHSKS